MRIELPRNWKVVAGLAEATSAWEDQQDDPGSNGVGVLVTEWSQLDVDVVKDLKEALKVVGITVQETPESVRNDDIWCLTFSRRTLTDAELREIDVDHNLTDEGL